MAKFTGLVFLCAHLASAIVQLPPPPSHNQLSHTYLVRFTPDITPQVRDDHLAWIKSLESSHQDVALRHTFSLAWDGYSAVLDHAALDQVRRRDEVLAIDNVGLSAKQAEPAPLSARDLEERDAAPLDPVLPNSVTTLPNRGWNAARISHRNYTSGYNNGPWVKNKYLGKGVTVYVLDTGVALKNQGFRGTPVSFGKNFVGWRYGIGRTSDNDVHGHGTMCAGVIAGEKHGLSPEAKMVAVKIANDQNRSACDDVVAGIEWVVKQPGDNNMKVISMSHYGFTGKPDVSTAVAAAVARGVHFVVCAGNDGMDSCRIQPSNAPGVISVGSINGFNKIPIKGTTDAGGREMEGSNVGKCITVFAPGTRVPSLSNKNLDWAYRYYSWGTSVAAPQVAALVANRLSEVGKQTPKQIREWLQETGTKGQVQGDLRGAPNVILYNGLGA